MPHPRRLSPHEIIAAARGLLESGGPDALTMRALARTLGVTAPSLYFHVESRDDLLRELIQEGLRELGEAMEGPPAVSSPPGEALRHMADRYVRFAEGNPQLFALVFAPCEPDDAIVALGERASAPLLASAAALVGPERALFFAQAAWSLVHGYTVLRLASQFRVNPEHQAGFAYALDLLVAGAQVAPPAPRR